MLLYHYIFSVHLKIGFLLNIADWLEQHSRTCFYKKHFGFECFGCGFQRAIIELLRGNVWESIKQYPALIPLIILFVVLLSHIKFRHKHGALIIKVLFLLSVALIVGNFLFRVC